MQQRWNNFVNGPLAEMNRRNETNLVSFSDVATGVGGGGTLACVHANVLSQQHILSMLIAVFMCPSVVAHFIDDFAGTKYYNSLVSKRTAFFTCCACMCSCRVGSSL